MKTECKCGQIVMFGAECDCEKKARLAMRKSIISHLKITAVMKDGALTFRDNSSFVRSETDIPDGTEIVLHAKEVYLP
jgi:hypothetical protein